MPAFRTVTDSARPLRVVQIGTVGLAEAWIDAARESPDVEIVAMVDEDPAAARAGAVRYGVPDLTIAPDLSMAARETRPDAVIVVAPPFSPLAVTPRIVMFGLPVLTEQPIAEGVTEALSLAAASELTGELFMVAQDRRHDDNLLAFKQHAGLLGRVGILSSQFAKAPHFGGFQEQMDDPLLNDMSIHSFDTARFLLDADPLAVYCESYNPSWSRFAGDAAAMAIFEFPDGVRYSYDGSWASPGLETSWNGAWRITGERGTAVWDGDHAPYSEVDGVPGMPGPLLTRGRDIRGSLGSFVHALRTGETPDGEVHNTLMSLAMVEAAIASKALHRRVKIDALLDSALEQAIVNEKQHDVRGRLQSWGSARPALERGPR